MTGRIDFTSCHVVLTGAGDWVEISIPQSGVRRLSASNTFRMQTMLVLWKADQHSFSTGATTGGLRQALRTGASAGRALLGLSGTGKPALRRVSGRFVLRVKVRASRDRIALEQIKGCLFAAPPIFVIGLHILQSLWASYTFPAGFIYCVDIFVGTSTKQF